MGAMGALQENCGGVAGALRERGGNVAGTLIDRTRQTKADGLLLAVIVVFD